MPARFEASNVRFEASNVSFSVQDVGAPELVQRDVGRIAPKTLDLDLRKPFVRWVAMDGHRERMNEVRRIPEDDREVARRRRRRVRGVDDEYRRAGRIARLQGEAFILVRDGGGN